MGMFDKKKLKQFCVVAEVAVTEESGCIDKSKEGHIWNQATRGNIACVVTENPSLPVLKFAKICSWTRSKLF